MAVMMSDCEATARRWGQRGRLRHNNQIEAVAGGGWRRTSMARTDGDRRLWRQAAAAGAVTAALSVAVVAGGYGGDGRLWRRRRERR